MPKTERILNVMQRVYERQNFTVGELAEEFSVSYRTMLRYLHELSRLGVPLYANEGKNGGYSILTSRQKRERSEQTNETIQRIIKPRTLIVGLEMKLPFTAYYMSQALKPRLWQELQNRMEEIPYIRHKTPNPLFIAAVLNRQPIYHYVAGFEVSTIRDMPERMVGLTLPTQEYAMYTHEGHSEREDTDQSYSYVLQLLKQRGLMPNPEHYSLELRTSVHASKTQIYIPIT
ncbi:effector binding domain-containing protein [Paenibacillus sp. JNUCC32]|uniref:GyrI-like domain-containing protein n=1 Tax=unclassified Paenibacillus TaxID=185978 RepID=UPI0017889BBB|nr:GyrI-like domain-containing protein [Paenibacillus sp. JNUCC-32]QOT10634.1 effector binding domain-containing protein [Paenibacillus sp. JNUCC-32]